MGVKVGVALPLVPRAKAVTSGHPTQYLLWMRSAFPCEAQLTQRSGELNRHRTEGKAQPGKAKGRRQAENLSKPASNPPVHLFLIRTPCP